MQELITNFVHPGNGKSYKLDANSGTLYDPQTGAQVGRMSVVDDAKTLDHCKSVNASLQNGVYGRRGTIASGLRDGVSMSSAFRSSVESANAAPLLARSDFDEEKLARMSSDYGLAIGDVHQPAPLPNYSAGYKNEMPLADVVAPPLLVDQISGKYYTWDAKDAFQPVTPLVGGTSSSVGRVQARVSNSSYAAVEFALGSFVPTQLEAAADAALKVRLACARRVMNAMMIGREQRVSQKATTSGNWASGNVVALGGGFNWNGGASSDPVKDLQNRIDASPMRPTGLLWNQRVWFNFVRNPAVQKFFTYKSGVAPIPEPTQLAALLELPPIYVSRMRWLTAANTYDYIWPDDAVLFRQSPQMPPTDQEDVSTFLTFRWNAANAQKGGDVQSASGGFIVREFYNQIEGTMGGTMIVILMHDYEAVTSNFSGGLITGIIQ
jgi:hypothetical protein